MSNGKEIKKSEKPNRDPKSLKRDFNEFFQNRLGLPDALKAKLKAEGKVWRFLNKIEFRNNGNVHQSHWLPYKLDCKPDDVGLFGTTAEGYIERGDLILGVRDVEVAKAHRQHLNEKNDSYKGYAKNKAKELRKSFQDAGMADQATVHEGYEDGE